MSVRVVSAGIGPMLRFVNAVDVDAEEGIGEVAMPQSCRIGEEEVDEEATKGEEDAKAKLAEAVVNLKRGYDAVVVAIPKSDMPLQCSEVGHEGAGFDTTRSPTSDKI